MHKTHTSKHSKNIYEILGIKPYKSKKPQSKLEETSFEAPINLDIDPGAPSGSIFDNYSNYPENEQSYWTYFRILTIVGIVITILTLVFAICGESILEGMSRTTYYEKSSVYEESSEKSYDYYKDYDKDDDNANEAQSFEAIEETKEIEESDDALSGTMYFNGLINEKYKIHMMLDFDNREGKYYYDKSGASNYMTITIENLPNLYDNTLSLDEYNDDGEYCGSWEGQFDGITYSGTGRFLGKSMPFELNICTYSETDF